MNQGLIDHFDKLIQYYYVLNEKWRIKTFQKVVEIIEEYPAVIISGKDIEDIKGIGPSTVQEVNEFLQKGTSDRLEALKSRLGDALPVLALFKTIFGVGPVKAAELYVYGYRTIGELSKAPLSDASRTYLKYYYEFEERIPRSEMDMFYQAISERLVGWTWELAGSYRRGEASSGDIDLLVQGSGSDMKEIVQLLGPLITDILALGKKKVMGVAKIASKHRRIDIRLFPKDTWPFALLYNTGSGKMNILMRIRAQDLKMHLNEYSLTKKGVKIDCRNEREIFEALKIRYYTPEERTKYIVYLQYT